MSLKERQKEVKKKEEKKEKIHKKKKKTPRKKQKERKNSVGKMGLLIEATVAIGVIFFPSAVPCSAASLFLSRGLYLLSLYLFVIQFRELFQYYMLFVHDRLRRNAADVMDYRGAKCRGKRSSIDESSPSSPSLPIPCSCPSLPAS